MSRRRVRNETEQAPERIRCAWADADLQQIGGPCTNPDEQPLINVWDPVEKKYYAVCFYHANLWYQMYRYMHMGKVILLLKAKNSEGNSFKFNLGEAIANRNRPPVAPGALDLNRVWHEANVNKRLKIEGSTIILTTALNEQELKAECKPDRNRFNKVDLKGIPMIKGTATT